MRIVPAAKNAGWFAWGAVLAVIPFAFVAYALHSIGFSTSVLSLIFLLLLSLIYTEFLGLMGFLNLRVLFFTAGAGYVAAMILTGCFLLQQEPNSLKSLLLFLVSISWTGILIGGSLLVGLILQGIVSGIIAIIRHSAASRRNSNDSQDKTHINSDM